jgi:N-acetylglucosamine malate deacetylase 2
MMLDPLSLLLRGSEQARVLIVAAHPDDEVIGAGSRLALFDRLTIVHVTDGAPRNMYDARRHGFRRPEEYEAARRNEFRDALRIAGARPDCIELGIPDQEATLNAPHIVPQLSAIIGSFRPDFMMTHAYEGGHPDHDACALAVHLSGDGTPLVEFTSYHTDGGALRTGQFLNECAPVLTVELSPAEQNRKRAMLACFRTQAETLALFGVAAERFRMAPVYDFSVPPHPGPLYYEQFDWGMTSKTFCGIAREVLQTC